MKNIKPVPHYKVLQLGMLFCGLALCAEAFSQDEDWDSLFGEDETAEEALTPTDDAAEPQAQPSSKAVAEPKTYADVVTLDEVAPPEQPKVRGPKTQIEEIIVTAQKRSEDVRDVPIAISVMSGDELRDAAVSSFDDMAKFIPNVSFNTDFNSLYLRGIGTAEVNVIGEQAVVYMLDEVYVSRLDFLKPGFMDLQQIEVLKGPQGTLYGRNATGGVINIGYGEPNDEEWVGALSMIGGDANRKEVEGMVSGPIGDRFGLRIAARSRQEDGQTENLHDGTTIGDKDIQQLRVKFRADLSDNLELSLGAELFDYYIGVWAGNETFVYPDNLRPAIVALDPNFETELDRRGSANIPNRSDGQGIVAPLKLNWDWGEYTFTSITAYAELNDIQGGDLDGNGADLAVLFADTTYDQFSQELRVVSPPGDIEYVAGLFYFESLIATDLDIPLGPNYAGLGSGIPGPDLGALLPIPGLQGLLDTTTDLVSSVPLNDYNALANINGLFSVDVESIGVFGQATWRPTDTISLLLGARYSRDVKFGSAVLTDEGPVPIWTALVLGGYSTTKEVVDENFSPKVSLTWEPADAVTLYATYAKGFRAGSFNVAAFSEDDLEFDAETSTTYEAGIKTSLFGGLVRFNLGGFFTLYDDYQLSTFNGFSYVISNAEEVQTQGIESDVTALLWPGLILNASIGYNDAVFNKHTEGSCPTYEGLEGPPQGIAALPPKQTCDLSGQQLFRAPKYTGSIRLAYEAPLFKTDMDFFIGGDAAYKGGEFMDSDLDPLDYEGSYWIYNARIGIKASDNGWRFEVHGKNLTDTLAKTFSGDVPLQAGAHWALTTPPRTIFGSLRLEF
ncbi:MAG: TonB-dependent receptor [Oceanococcus sp.]